MFKPSSANSVAVVIAAYNASNTIGKAVKSALAQENVSQVIVVDDASTDNTMDIAKAEDDGTQRLVVLSQNENQGPAAARNVALHHVSADWFTVLDADDYMLEGRLTQLIAEEADGTFDIIADDLWLTQEGDTSESYSSMLGIDKDEKASALTIETFISGNIPQKDKMRRELGFLKPLIRTSALENDRFRYNEKMRLGEDYDLYVRLLANDAKACLTSAKGYVAVRRYNSLSGQHGHTELQYLYESTRAHQKLQNLSTKTRKLMRLARKNASRKYRWAKMIHDTKTKNRLGFISCFLTSPDNIVFLIQNLKTSLLDRMSKQKGANKNLEQNS